VKKTSRFLILITVVFGLSSCLTTEVELDLRRQNDLRLTLVYHMPLTLWQFGVFDDESSERAVPVSRRDAEETAVLHDDVTLERYSLEERNEEAVITVVYHSKTPAGIAAVWGDVAGQFPDLSFETETLVLPLTPGLGDAGADADQKQLMDEVFADQFFQVSLRLPDEVVSGEYPDIAGSETETSSDGRTVIWRTPMAALLTAGADQLISVAW
jgi:hypothetical protein